MIFTSRSISTFFAELELGVWFAVDLSVSVISARTVEERKNDGFEESQVKK